MTQTVSDGGVIDVRNVSYAYPGAQTQTLRDISFSVSDGEIFGLLGPSGAGKSTLQRLLTRQIRHDGAGAIRVLGRAVTEWDQSLYEQVGVGFELPNHYLRLTGRENLAFFAKFYRSQTRAPEDVMALVGLSDALDKRVDDYSKGMKVRLNFARAILHDPKLLFLDEPTTGLDPTTAAQLKAAISDLRDQGKTIVLTTHNMHDADQLCDRVGFIATGELRALDAPSALKENHGEKSLDIVAQDGEAARFALAGLGENETFLAFIRNRAVKTIHSREASLEEVFRIVTGEHLTQGPLA